MADLIGPLENSLKSDQGIFITEQGIWGTQLGIISGIKPILSREVEAEFQKNR